MLEFEVVQISSKAGKVFEIICIFLQICRFSVGKKPWIQFIGLWPLESLFLSKAFSLPCISTLKITKIAASNIPSRKSITNQVRLGEICWYNWVRLPKISKNKLLISGWEQIYPEGVQAALIPSPASLGLVRAVSALGSLWCSMAVPAPV